MAGGAILGKVEHVMLSFYVSMTETKLHRILLAILFFIFFATTSGLAQENKVVEIPYPGHASGPFRTGDIVEVDFYVRNLGNESRLVWVGLTIVDPKEVSWDMPPRQIFLEANRDGETTFLWTVPPTAPAGEYKLVMKVWGGMRVTLMTDFLEGRVIERAFYVIGPAIRAEDAMFFILTIALPPIYSFYKKEEQSPGVILFNGVACHGFAAALWNLPFRTQVLEWVFWIFVGWGYLMFLALAIRDELVKRRAGLDLVSFSAPASLMIGTLFYIYYTNDPVILIVVTLALIAAFNSAKFVYVALSKFRRIDRNKTKEGNRAMK